LQTLLKIPGFSDNIVTHLLSGLGAGFIAVCVGSPVDVVSMLTFNQSLQRLLLDENHYVD
jgi:solute carrier family 25 uncoupling protein 8/9